MFPLMDNNLGLRRVVGWERDQQCFLNGRNSHRTFEPTEQIANQPKFKASSGTQSTLRLNNQPNVARNQSKGTCLTPHWQFYGHHRIELCNSLNYCGVATRGIPTPHTTGCTRAHIQNNFQIWNRVPEASLPNLVLIFDVIIKKANDLKKGYPQPPYPNLVHVCSCVNLTSMQRKAMIGLKRAYPQHERCQSILSTMTGNWVGGTRVYHRRASPTC